MIKSAETILKFLNTDMPPIPGELQQNWAQSAKSLVIKSPRAFIDVLKTGSPSQQQNALLALRQADIDAYDVGSPAQSVYEVILNGEQFIIHPEQQLSPDLYTFDEPEIMLKRQLAGAFKNRVNKLRLTQMQTHQHTGMTQAKVSAIVNGKLGDVSVERLMRALVSLGYKIDISVSQANASQSPGITAHFKE